MLIGIYKTGIGSHARAHHAPFRISIKGRVAHVFQARFELILAVLLFDAADGLVQRSKQYGTQHTESDNVSARSTWRCESYIARVVAIAAIREILLAVNLHKFGL
jgi:hypothetical protein